MKVRRDQKSPRYYAEWRDHRGRRHRWAGYTSRRLTERMGQRLTELVAARLEGATPGADLLDWLSLLPADRRAALSALGLLEGRGFREAEPLSNLIAAYRNHLQAVERSRMHVANTCGRITRVVAAVGAHTVADLEVGRVEHELHKWRESGLSTTTSNHYVTALKGFCRWLADEGRATFNPLARLRKLPTEPDRRRVRGVLSDGEIALLLDATKRGPVSFGLTGEQRYWLYRVALETGLRANELRHVTFDWAEPSVAVEAGYSKRRRRDVQPLRRQTARELKRWIRDNPWPMCPHRSAAMLQGDLARAKVRTSNSSGEVVDFHALRHTFISRLAAAGVHPKVAQELARHSTITLTMDHYTHVGRASLASALEDVPSVERQKPLRKRAPKC